MVGSAGTEYEAAYAWYCAQDEIPLDRFRTWMASSELRVKGVACSVLGSIRHYERIRPSLPSEEAFRFLRGYYLECMERSPEAEDHVHSRYSAGHELGRLYRRVRRDPDGRAVLADIRADLATLLRKGDPELSTCVRHAILEHLLGEPGVMEDFAEWRKDALLSRAMDESLEDSGGGFPLLP